jgi:flagellar hook protein FlgE
MGFQQGLSGLNTAAKALDATSNNIANASTVGFKSSTAHFGDVFAASLAGGGASQVGIGGNVAAIQQQFTQGNITSTNNPLDISINGAGFFRMSSNGEITFTRNGQFHLDKNGYMVNDQSLQVTGYAATESGVIVPSSAVPIQISASDLPPIPTGSSSTAGFRGVRANLQLDSRVGQPVVTPWVASVSATAGSVSAAVIAAGGSPAEAAAASAAFGGTPAAIAAAVTAAGGSAIEATAASSAAAGPLYTPNPQSYNYSTALSVFDSLGNAHALTMYMVKTGTAGQWEVRFNVDGTRDTYVNGGAASVVTFNPDGSLASGSTIPLSIDLTSINAALGLPSNAFSPMTFDVDLAGSTQFGSSFGTNRLEQDGYAAGRLVGLSVDSDGLVQGRYSNGQTLAKAQIVMANFTSPTGLQSLGNNQWTETSTSGPALIGAPNTSTLGSLSSSTVEESNVDLTAELVNLITLQRNYQANAQSIKTQDQVLQTLVNLR